MARNPFGGKKISFSGRLESMEQVFGREPLAPSAMTKKLWEFVKANALMK